MERSRAMLAVSAAFVSAILVATAVVPQATAIANGTFDTTHKYAGLLLFPNPGFTFYTGHTEYAGCSGTLIAPRVFLTVAHCFDVVEGFGIPLEALAVSLADNVFEDPKSWIPVTSYQRHPDYKVREGAPYNDVAIVILAKPAKGISPAAIAPAGFLDAYEGLPDAALSLLGYGVNDTFVFTGDRRITTSGFVELGETYVKLSGSPGTFCPGDSGGPSLLPSGGVEYLVSIHGSRVGHTLKPPCEGPAFDQRLDTPGVQAFIQGAIAAMR